MAESTCSGCSTASSCEHKDQDQKLRNCLGRIKHKLVILSGKGGVGKSSVAANLAVDLALHGNTVGLLDVDVHGPSIPRLLSLSGRKPEVREECLIPISWNANLSVMSLGFMLPNRDDSVIWRGPIKMSLIRQFLEDVAWNDLDYLVVDCPPGTGDEPISVLQLLGQDARALIVTTPQVLAIDDVRRSVNFCRHTGNPVLGIVENMSTMICPHCRASIEVFTTGGGQALAEETGVPFLGRIPLDPEIVRAGDEGSVFVTRLQDSPSIQAVHDIAGKVMTAFAETADSSGQSEDKTAKGEQPMKDGSLRIAIPVAQGKLCNHFGHCEQFALVDIRDKTVTGVEYVTPPPHEPGVLPGWIAEQQADVVLAGGMGAKAMGLFKDKGITVLTGAPQGTPEELAEAYINETLATGQNVCDH